MVLAVIFTCYNRKDKTLDCVNRLLPQLEKLHTEYRFYICDDKSTDGTYQELKRLLPEHKIIQSQGNYYWSKGMEVVMQLAVDDGCDYYLMVNDDVSFFDNAVATIFSAYSKAGGMCGIVGSTISREQNSITYGGRIEQNAAEPIKPGKDLENCFYCNWNCFFVDYEVIKKIGIIDGKYKHGFGDYDYSSRMKNAKIPMYIACAYVGFCEKNGIKGTYRDVSLPRRERLKKLLSPKGAPISSYFRYYIKNGGMRMVPGVLYGYALYMFAILLKKEI